MSLHGLVRSKNKDISETQTTNVYLSHHSEPAESFETNTVRLWLYNRYLARRRLVRDVRRSLQVEEKL
jgi:hypothetical protein